MQRRQFIKHSSTLSLGVMAMLNSPLGLIDMIGSNSNNTMFFKISLAEWSLNKSIFAKKLDHLDFALKAKSFGLDGIEYVNQFFMDKAENSSYLAEMNSRANGEGVTQLLIMIDREGGLAELDDKIRNQAVENHYKWVHAAKTLGCHSIRVNAFGQGSRDDTAKAAVQGLAKLAEYGAKENINVIVENHGGYSSDGSWLAAVMSEINMPNCGTLPDFGNFCVKRQSGQPWGSPCIEEYDKYLGVEEMMPFAKAVSAKAMNFNAEGDEKDIDFLKIMKIVKDHGYSGYVGIEYEGSGLSEEEGILATKKLLMRVGKQLSN